MSKLSKFTKGIAAVGVACSMLLFPVTGASAAEKLRMVTSLPAPSFLYKDIISVWAKNVTDASNGTLDVEVFPAGALGRDPASHLDMVSSGVADIGKRGHGQEGGRPIRGGGEAFAIGVD